METVKKIQFGKDFRLYLPESEKVTLNMIAPEIPDAPKLAEQIRDVRRAWARSA